MSARRSTRASRIHISFAGENGWFWTVGSYANFILMSMLLSPPFFYRVQSEYGVLSTYLIDFSISRAEKELRARSIGRNRTR